VGSQEVFKDSFCKSRQVAEEIMSDFAARAFDYKGAELVVKFEMRMRMRMDLAIRRVSTQSEKLGYLFGYIKAVNGLFEIANKRPNANANELSEEFRNLLAVAQIQLPEYSFSDSFLE